MYRTLADPEMLCRLPHGRVIVNNISGNLHGSFLNITFQKNSPAILVFTLYAGVFYVIQISFCCFFYRKCDSFDNLHRKKLPCTSVIKDQFFPAFFHKRSYTHFPDVLRSLRLNPLFLVQLLLIIAEDSFLLETFHAT